MSLQLIFQLIIAFFKTGLFALGGGLATIPFLYEMIKDYGWFTKDMLMNMIAVSESTPGPMGVNMATYVGFHTTKSVIGGIVTTFLLVISLILKKNNKIVQILLSGLMILIYFSIWYLQFN